MSDDVLYVEYGENTGPYDWGDGIDPVALATTQLMASYMVDAEVRDTPPASEVRIWPHVANQDYIRAHGVVLAPCIFYIPVRPPKFEKLHGFMSDAIKAGKLPLRDIDTLYPFRLDQVADINGDIRQDAYISIADVWKWQRAAGIPTFKTAKELWKWCNPRLYGWYGRYTLPDADDVETFTEVQTNGATKTTTSRIGARKTPTPEQVKRFNDSVAVNWDVSNNMAMKAFSDWLFKQEGGDPVTPRTLGKYFEVNFADHVLIPTDECKKVWAEKGMMENNDDGK